MPPVRKIINDPVYGFITIDDPLLWRIVCHSHYQRLRHIHQMAFAHLVYPGAVHSRLHHSLGAYHLMTEALNELKRKGIDISPEEEQGARIAILLHDIGHGPFSHAFEKELIPGAHHETISLLIMEEMNREFGGALQTALDIFTNRYPKQFLHQLVSGQLDVDRMDYLNRDSFFTGVAEGVIGYDRILKMLTVIEGELMVEEKAIYSIEKFLLSRRLMYWQVYLHKTVVSAEMTMVRIVRRAKELIKSGVEVRATTSDLDYFLQRPDQAFDPEQDLTRFCRLDDHDVMSTIKNWAYHSDRILSELCGRIIERRLLKIRLQADPVEQALLESKQAEAQDRYGVSAQEASYLAFTGEASNTLYNPGDERIRILFKDGTVRDISEVDHALIQQGLSGRVKKYYICYPGA
ncbi:MAG: HD domain-containing protein [Bacteroidota bacterium]